MTLDELNELIKPEALDLFEKNKTESPDSFALNFAGVKELPIRAIAEQIGSYKKACHKLPLLSDKKIFYEKTALEQCSGEAAAGFKLNLLKGTSILDMTGGMGIDSIYFSKSFENVVYCEQNPVLFKLANYNFDQLNISNIKLVPGDSVDWLEQNLTQKFDWIYLDPARRDENRRSVDLKYCQPNIYEIKELLFQRAKNILVKVSPAFDFTEAKNKLPELNEFIVVSVDGECKEVLLILNKSKSVSEQVKISAVVLKSNDEKNYYSINNYENENPQKKIASLVKGYFYEPDAAIIKSGLSRELASKYGLLFINNAVDYLVGEVFHEDFPGRKFQIHETGYFKKELFKKFLSEKGIASANIARRDFPLSVQELRKVFKLKEGGSDFIFFTRNQEKKNIFILAQ